MVKKIKTIGDLKKAIESLPEDFELNMTVSRELSPEELSETPYGYPFLTMDSQLEMVDVGYSDKIVKFVAEI